MESRRLATPARRGESFATHRSQRSQQVVTESGFISNPHCRNKAHKYSLFVQFPPVFSALWHRLPMFSTAMNSRMTDVTMRHSRLNIWAICKESGAEKRAAVVSLTMLKKLKIAAHKNPTARMTERDCLCIS